MRYHSSLHTNKHTNKHTNLNNRSTAIRYLREHQNDKDNAQNHANLANLWANHEKHNPHAQAEWLKWAAYFFAFTKNVNMLTACAVQFIANSPQQATQDALNADLQQTNPIYCAQLSRLLAQNASNHESWSAWIKLAAYCFALAGNEMQLIDCARQLTLHHPEQATQDALNPHLQQTNPIYCAQLSRSLAQQAPNHESWSAWIKLAAYYFALAGNKEELIACARQFIVSNPLEATQDALNPHLQQTNPIYCAQLSRLLAQNASNHESGTAWIKLAAYCFALAGNKEELIACAVQFINRNLRQATHDALNYNVMQKNPFYCANLCELLEQHPREHKEKSAWKSCAAFNYSKISFFNTSEKPPTDTRSLRFPSWYW